VVAAMRQLINLLNKKGPVDTEVSTGPARMCRSVVPPASKKALLHGVAPGKVL
jgi:hypothetical protein